MLDKANEAIMEIKDDFIRPAGMTQCNVPDCQFYPQWFPFGTHKHFIPPEELDDRVNHPRHYTSHPSGIECIQITRHMGFNLGNAVKYLWRNGLKDQAPDIEDLEKAVWYIQDEIKERRLGEAKSVTRADNSKQYVDGKKDALDM